MFDIPQSPLKLDSGNNDKETILCLFFILINSQTL